MPKSHKIASRQAELARKKRKHFEPQPSAGEALQAGSASTEAAYVATAPQVPEEVRARPSLMSSYRAVATQPDTAKRSSSRTAITPQAEYFGADIRRLLVTIVICLALMAGLTFALR